MPRQLFSMDYMVESTLGPRITNKHDCNLRPKTCQVHSKPSALVHLVYPSLQTKMANTTVSRTTCRLNATLFIFFFSFGFACSFQFGSASHVFQDMGKRSSSIKRTLLHKTDWKQTSQTLVHCSMCHCSLWEAEHRRRMKEIRGWVIYPLHRFSYCGWVQWM